LTDTDEAYRGLCVHCELRPRIQLTTGPGNPAPLVECPWCEQCAETTGGVCINVRHLDSDCKRNCLDPS
jgi:hypothetical protein